MTEVKTDIFSGRRVLFVAGRAQRPSDWPQVAAPQDEAACPFCPGHEAETPAELWALRAGAPDSPGWQIRVIPNKYPIVEPHELIIETPQHRLDLPDLPPQQAEQVIATYQQRMRALAQHKALRYLSLFKNQGRAAGASRAHAHAQLIGLPWLPPLIEAETEIAQRSYAEGGRCLYCQTIERELGSGERVIESDEHFLVWSPYAARLPYECWILPRVHRHDFCRLSSAEISSFTRILQCTLARLRGFLGAGRWAYNFYLHTAPLPAEPGELPQALEASYHWHLELLPRLTKLAGLEWSSGLYVNPVPPEEAARALRAASSAPAVQVRLA